MTSDQGPIRWGVLSTAKIGRNHVVPALHAAAGADVLAIASRDRRRAERVASELAIPRHYGSYEELLADGDVDAVYIPLPNHLHRPWTLAAIDAGKHVLCEKPLGLTADEARTMVDRAAYGGVLLGEGFMYRHHPAWETIFDLVASDAIGDVVAIQSWFSYDNDDPGNIRNRPEWGGGALLDIGCYPISITRRLLGDDPDGVDATMSIDPETNIDVVTSAIVDYGHAHSGFTVSMRAKWSQRVAIMGTTGQLWTDRPFNPRRDQPVTVHLDRDDGVDVITVEPADQFRIQMERFGRAIRGEGPFPPADDAVANMMMIERVAAAAGRTTTG